MLTTEQQSVLVQWRNLLVEAGLDRVLVRPAASEPAPIAEGFQGVARLFGEGRAVDRHDLEAGVPDDVLATLEALGLVNRNGDKIEPCYRLECCLGLWLFFEKMSPSARLYHGRDSVEFGRVLVGATGNVLDLCSGVGTQALVCARTATHVTAVEIEPLAAKLFWTNAAMNGVSDKMEFLTGDFFAPVAGRRFDVIACHPPYLPVPPEVRYPVLAAGGADGLDFIRRLLAGLPEALTPGGRCEAVGALLGNNDGPDLAPLKKMAADSSLAIIVDCHSRDELAGANLKHLVEIAMKGAEEDVERAFQNHFSRLGATHIYCCLLHALLAPSPMVCASFFDGERMAFRILPFP